jgi:predicted nucleic acid-binding protein
MKKAKIRWLGKTQKHDYPAALSYLSLFLQPTVAKAVVEKLKRAQITEFAAKDIFRASTLPLLGNSDVHVEKYRQLIIRKEPLSPLLLCRDAVHNKLIIADGYHRLCAVYTFDEDAVIPCQII